MKTHELNEVPVFSPTMQEFEDFEAFCRRPDVWHAGMKHGIIKVQPPPQWHAMQRTFDVDNLDTNILDISIPTPAKQVPNGRKGIYEVMLFEQKALTVREFQEQANSPKFCAPASLAEHVVSKNYEAIEASFWKNLSYGEPPSYGADMSGSIFPKDMHTWNLDQLDTMLHRLMNERELPGVLSAYLYFGMWRAFFGIHVEDMNLFSINYLHFGAPKHWYAVGQANAQRIESLAEGQYPQLYRDCHEFLRHKNTMIAPTVLMRESIPVSHTVQEAGQYVITFPHGYHWGFNQGFNCAEATNFATENWIPYGEKAKWCKCIDDAVRIDMPTLRHRLKLYNMGVPNFKSYDPVEVSAAPEAEDGPATGGRMRKPGTKRLGVKGSPKGDKKKSVLPVSAAAKSTIASRAKLKTVAMYTKLLNLESASHTHIHTRVSSSPAKRRRVLPARNAIEHQPCGVARTVPQRKPSTRQFNDGREVKQRAVNVQSLEQAAQRAAEDLVAKTSDEIFIKQAFTTRHKVYTTGQVTHSPARRRFFVRMTTPRPSDPAQTVTPVVLVTAWLQYRLSKSKCKLEVQDVHVPKALRGMNLAEMMCDAVFEHAAFQALRVKPSHKYARKIYLAKQPDRKCNCLRDDDAFSEDETDLPTAKVKQGTSKVTVDLGTATKRTTAQSTKPTRKRRIDDEKVTEQSSWGAAKRPRDATAARPTQPRPNQGELEPPQLSSSPKRLQQNPPPSTQLSAASKNPRPASAQQMAERYQTYLRKRGLSRLAAAKLIKYILRLDGSQSQQAVKARVLSIGSRLVEQPQICERLQDTDDDETLFTQALERAFPTMAGKRQSQGRSAVEMLQPSSVRTSSDLCTKDMAAKAARRKMHQEKLAVLVAERAKAKAAAVAARAAAAAAAAATSITAPTKMQIPNSRRLPVAGTHTARNPPRFGALRKVQPKAAPNTTADGALAVAGPPAVASAASLSPAARACRLPTPKRAAQDSPQSAAPCKAELEVDALACSAPSTEQLQARERSLIAEILALPKSKVATLPIAQQKLYQNLQAQQACSREVG